MTLLDILAKKGIITEADIHALTERANALGGDIEVLVRGERIKLKIPAGVQNGEALVHHGKNGDIIFVVDIKMPKNLSGKARELLEKLRDELK